MRRMIAAIVFGSICLLGNAVLCHSAPPSTDDLLMKVEEGNVSEISDIRDLGQRNDPRILPLLLRVAEKYEYQSRLALRKHDGGVSEKANESFFRGIEVPVEEEAKKAAARQGAKRYFDYFVAGLSSKDGSHKMDCIKVLKFIGDRAAIKYLIPIVDDHGVPYVAEGRQKPPEYSDIAIGVIANLIPADDLPAALKGNYIPDKSRSAIKQWWKKNKSKYERLEFGKEKAFEVPVGQQ